MLVYCIQNNLASCSLGAGQATSVFLYGFYKRHDRDLFIISCRAKNQLEVLHIGKSIAVGVVNDMDVILLFIDKTFDRSIELSIGRFKRRRNFWYTTARLLLGYIFGL